MSIWDPYKDATATTPDVKITTNGQQIRSTDPLNQYTNLGRTGTASSNAFEYGGGAGVAGQDISRARDQGRSAQQRQATLADYGQANDDRQSAANSRTYQADALGMYRNAALGNGPSAAQSQFQSNLDSSLRAQQAMANSARGGASAVAAAQMRAQGAMGDLSGQAAQQSAALRAQEQQAAMQGYAGLGTGMRGQDLQSQGLSAQQAQYNASLQANQGARNDAMQQFWESQGMHVGDQQMASQIAKQSMLAQLAGSAESGIRQDSAADAAEQAERRRLLADTISRTTSSIAGGMAGGMGGK